MSLIQRIKRRLLSPVAARLIANADRHWYEAPFGTEPRADRAGYLALWEEARARTFDEISGLESELGHAIPKDWLDELALQTQIVVKPSRLNYQHGRILYAVLRNWLDRHPDQRDITILETGTARGFSALCMARALADGGATGRILTMDVLPHDTPFLWNCIADVGGRTSDDRSGPASQITVNSRRDLLKGYDALLEKIIFLQGDTRSQIGRLGLGRVPFAYLDAQHTYDDVMAEAEVVIARQNPGDMIIFDDVTEQVFPGVVKAVDEIARSRGYRAKTLKSDAERGYALLTRQA